MKNWDKIQRMNMKEFVRFFNDIESNRCPYDKPTEQCDKTGYTDEDGFYYSSCDQCLEAWLQSETWATQGIRQSTEAEKTPDETENTYSDNNEEEYINNEID